MLWFIEGSLSEMCSILFQMQFCVVMIACVFMCSILEKKPHELSLFLQVALYLSSNYTSGVQSTVQKMYNKRLGWITRFDTSFSCWFMMSFVKFDENLGFL